MAFDFLTTAEIIVGVALFISSIILTVKCSLFWRRKYKDELISYGIYSRIRNPHYLPVLMIILSFFIVHRDIINLIFLASSSVLIHLSIKKEESQFIKRYGDEYREYMKKVPYRLIPRVY